MTSVEPVTARVLPPVSGSRMLLRARMSPTKAATSRPVTIAQLIVLLISRTIGWAIVTGLLVTAFVVLILGLSSILEPLTGGSTLAVTGSTLVTAALFAPLRNRVQGAVDRRFDRSRYDGERLLAAFGERRRNQVDLGMISDDVLATVDRAVRPSQSGLWLRNPEHP